MHGPTALSWIYSEGERDGVNPVVYQIKAGEDAHVHMTIRN